MATTTSITTTYAGESAGKYVSAALLSADTIEKGLIEVIPNVKYKQVVKKLSTDDLVKDGTCDFDATSTITTTERILQPKELQVNLQLCKQNFRNDWDAISMGYSAFDVLPSSFADYLLGYVAAKAAAKNETNIWQGDASNNGQFDGFELLLSTDANLPAANEVTGTTVNSGNVITELGKIVSAIPNAVYGKEDAGIYISRNIAKSYIAAQAALGYRNLYHDGMTDMNFQGIPLWVAHGLSDDTAIYAEKGNLYFGTGLMSDHQEVRVIDMADIDGSQNVRVIMRFTAGVQYANVEDIVTYGITNSVN